MAFVRGSLPNISGTLSPISLLSEDVELGVDICKLVTQALTSFMEIVLDFLSLATDVGVTLDDATITEAEAAGSTSFTQCARASQRLQQQLTGLPLSAGVNGTAGAGSESPFGTDGIITTAILRGFRVDRQLPEGRSLREFTVAEREAVIRARKSLQMQRAGEELVLGGGRKLLEAAELSSNSTAVSSFMLRPVYI
jgi:hypothetical protein